MSARVCPSCGDLHRPRGEHDREQCWRCGGYSLAEHLALIGDPVVAHKIGARPSVRPAQPEAAQPEYLQRIESLPKT